MTDIVLSCNPSAKQVCIKITPDIRPSTGIADHAIANDLCAADNTRLAVAETSSQRDGLVTWINKVYKPTSDVRTGLILRAENTHHGGKYHCTDDFLFDRYGFYQARKVDENST